MHDWTLCFDQHLRCALDMLWIRRDVHRHRNAFARKNSGFVVLVKHVARNANESWTTRSGGRNLVSVRNPFGNAIAFLHQPAPFRVLLESIQPIVQILVAVTPVSLRVHVIRDNHDRSAVLHRVIHVGAGDWTTNAAEAGERCLSGGFRVAISHRDRLILGNGLNELQIRPVDYGVAQRSHA